MPLITSPSSIDLDVTVCGAVPKIRLLCRTARKPELANAGEVPLPEDATLRSGTWVEPRNPKPPNPQTLNPGLEGLSLGLVGFIEFRLRAHWPFGFIGFVGLGV